MSNLCREYYYKIYGLNVKSEIEMPELLAIENLEEKEVDVRVIRGSIAEDIIKKIPARTWYKYDTDKMIFKVNELGAFYIENGEVIVVDELEGANSQLIKTFILGTSFGMILSQRGLLAMHGGTVLVDGIAIILTGQSGAGKSTLTNAFRHYEYPFMADDVSATNEENGEIYVYPAYPQQKICRDAMEKMGYNISEYKLIDEGREKYVIPTHKTFVRESKKLGAIFEIEQCDSDEVKIEEVLGHDKMKTILRNIYRIEVILPHGIPASYFKKAINIAKEVPVYRIKRPRNQFSVDKQIEKIKEILVEYMIQN